MNQKPREKTISGIINQRRIVREGSYLEVYSGLSNMEIISDFSKRNFGETMEVQAKLE